jgi:hypothetical protein
MLFSDVNIKRVGVYWNRRPDKESSAKTVASRDRVVNVQATASQSPAASAITTNVATTAKPNSPGCSSLRLRRAARLLSVVSPVPLYPRKLLSSSRLTFTIDE